MNQKKFKKNDTFLTQNKFTDSVFPCEICGYCFKHLKNLRRHTSVKHPNDFCSIFPKTEKNFKCSVCNHEFNHLRNLIRHEKIKHHILHQPKRIRLCLMCYMEVPSKSILSHYNEVHSIAMETINLEFSSLEEFQSWKESLETETCYLYVKECGTKYFDDTVKDVYICHRSGKARTRKFLQRNPKIQGSYKLNGYCPSSISLSVSKTTGRCCVEFIKTHIGHTNGLEKSFITEQQMIDFRKESIKPYKVLFEEEQDSKHLDEYKQIHILEKTPIHNIKKALNVNLLSMNSLDKNENLNLNRDLKSVNLKNKLLIKKLISKDSNLSLKKERLIRDVTDYINSLTSEEELHNFQKLILKSTQSKISFNNDISHSTPPNKRFCSARKSFSSGQKRIKSNCLSELDVSETSKITVIYLQPVNRLNIQDGS